MFYFRTVSVNPKMPERISRLQDLQYNLWFSWHEPALELYRQLNEVLWEDCYHNPVKFLLELHQEDLHEAAQDSNYLALYDQVIGDFDRYMNEEKWFHKYYNQHKDRSIAYFSAEFGLHESLPIYSGGLGVLAGDHTKAASDLGIPFIGVGLLYKQGYFTQRINREGWQEAFYPHYNFYQMPIVPAVHENGTEVQIPVDLPQGTVFLKVWEMKVGLAKIYLLDADVARNSKEDRALTAQLYGGDRDMRIKQEIILGIGGVKALRALGIIPYAWHINEGHASFLCIERIRELVQTGIPVATAKEVVKSNTLFTTHTPVPAGHDTFDEEKIDYYFGYLYGQLGMSRDQFMQLGWNKEHKAFNMTVLALNLSSYCNGVSRLHGEVSRKMFQIFFDQLPVEEVPITSVTNGVHAESWIAQEIKDLYREYLGNEWDKNISDQEQWHKVDNISDERIWNIHKKKKEDMIFFVRHRLEQKKLRNHESSESVAEVQNFLSPDSLTIGFARRFATYKRATLLFRNKERLAHLFNNPERPLQIIFSGKAHPADDAGKEFIQKIYQYANEEPFRGKIVFLEDYDINVARYLVQGVDVWLNTPRWPMEASGTSGMKVAMNGGLHWSVLDGWWPEGYNGYNGFAIGEIDNSHLSEQELDREDSYSLYALLEEVIIPSYYNREDHLPREWIKRVKDSIKTLSPVFNTGRMVQEYASQFYVNCIDRGLMFSEENFALAGRVRAFKQYLMENWHHVDFKNVNFNGTKDMNVGDELTLSATVRLGPINHNDVRVEIAYGYESEHSLHNIQTKPMNLVEAVGDGLYRYSGSLQHAQQGTFGYTVRIRPSSTYFANDFELPLVTWAGTF
ncbi:alpha-glucan phosphorylase [Desulfofarcimen acetoxidans DSM 771]|uniref:glycogen phosphorylase n=1 Tax=Desulfofarcimen acetoxidans (strain ATCC 49208 / DSM 771 / KCTC 5769 / VKM B-1644 / 5575) TaxID=485916 RepID=C8VX49_DESAS|nr:alpha-glucan family phosphorylase [Desulfofarcimen acetoxidans]ACV62625.1 alpha-glucan phosphorylase [Desulfofarcimen acetoxidans DSM 771]